MFQVGPYRFTAQDVRRTVEDYDAIWAELVAGRDATALIGLRASTTGQLERDLEAVWASLLAAGPALRAAGELPERTEGRVAQLNVSAGGVPKRSAPSIDVGWSGVAGDRQANRQHHGRPWQALCLWSCESIAALNAEGHRLAPGLAGENVTIEGLPWDHVRPGVRLALGTVLCEVSAFAIPCRQNASWFAGGDFRAMHASRGPVSRVYATVLRPGRIDVGDAAVLEP